MKTLKEAKKENKQNNLIRHIVTPTYGGFRCSKLDTMAGSGGFGRKGASFCARKGERAKGVVQGRSKTHNQNELWVSF